MNQNVHDYLILISNFAFYFIFYYFLTMQTGLAPTEPIVFLDTQESTNYKPYKTFNLFLYSRNSANAPLFLLHKSADSCFSHYSGAFMKHDPVIFFAVARDFVTKTGGLLCTQNLKFFLAEKAESLEIDTLVYEKDLKVPLLPQKRYTLSINDICKLLCECPYICEESNGVVSYFVEFPMLNTGLVNDIASEKKFSFKLKYFTLEEILINENKEVAEDLQKALINSNLLSYIKKFLLNCEPINHRDYYAMIACDPIAKSSMLPSLYYSIFKKHREHWRYYKAYEGDLPTEEDLKKLKGIIIPGSSHSAYDTSVHWFKDLFSLINKVHNDYKHINLLGVCFGAQVIAQALGGKVAKMEGKEFIRGGETLNVQPAFYNLEYIKDLGLNPNVPLVISQAHLDHIVELPQEAICQASSINTNVEVFTIGNNILALQGHPEFNEAWTAGANYRRGGITVEDYDKYAEDYIKEKFPMAVTQNELLTICYAFLKKNNSNERK